jgi:hypothetical protein
MRLVSAILWSLLLFTANARDASAQSPAGAAQGPPTYRPFVSAREMTDQERRVLKNDPGFTGRDDEREPEIAPPPEVEKAFESKLATWAKTHRPEGTEVTIFTSSSDGKIDGGTVRFTDALGTPLYEAEFQPDGTTTGLEETSYSKVSRFLEKYAPEGSEDSIANIQYAQAVDMSYYVSEVFLQGEDGAVLFVKFNEKGQPYEGYRTRTDGAKINDWHGTNPPPTYTDTGPPLASVPIQRVATGACPECAELASARNDIAEVMNEAAQEINWIAAEHARLSEIAKRIRSPGHELPPMRARYDFLKGVWDRLAVRLAAAHASFVECTVSRCAKLPEPPQTAVAMPSPALVQASPATAAPAVTAPVTPPATATAMPSPTGQSSAPAAPAADAAATAAMAPSASTATVRAEPFDPAQVQPSASAFPADDADLADVVATAQMYQSLGAACTEMECPKGDCARIADVTQALFDLEAHLAAMLEWAKLASADAGQNFRNQAAGSTLAAEQLYRTQLAQGLHQYLHNFASMLFNITSLFDGVKDIVTGKGLDEMSFTEVMERLDGVYEALKDLEGTIKTGADMAGDPNAPTPISDLVGQGTKGFDNTMINNTTSTLSDAMGTLRKIEEAGGDWRKFIKGGGLGGLGQVAGTWLTSYSEQQMKARLAAMDGLMTDIAAQQQVQGSAFGDYMRASARRHAIEDALDAVRAAKAAFVPCAQKVCGAFSLTRPQLPDFVDVAPDGSRRIASWGKALRYYNAAIAALTQRLKPPPEIRNECGGTAAPPALAFGSDLTPIDRTATGFWLSSDTLEWCRYGSAVPVPLTPPPGATPDTPGGTPTTPGGSPVFPMPPASTAGDDEDDARAPGSPTDTTPTPTEPTPPASTPVEAGPPESQPPPDLGNAKATAAVIEAGKSVGLVAGVAVKLLTDDTVNAALPGATGTAPASADTGYDAPPMQCTVDTSGACTLPLDDALCAQGGCALPPAITFEATEQSSVNVALPAGSPTSALPTSVLSYISDSLPLADKVYYTLTYPPAAGDAVRAALSAAPLVLSVQENLCDDKQPGPNDPLLTGRGAAAPTRDDQWGIRRVGFAAGAESAWARLPARPAAVVVAIVDTGLDWNHADLAWESLWRNPDEVPDNGLDDDANGYVDDIIGWDFVGDSNRPWDHDGHGTFVAGIVGASADNGIGIAGIAPNAKLMVLKALNNFGHSRRSFIAKAVKYAADNGAKVVNISAGGKGVTDIERDAIAYAHARGVVVVVAAGNEATDVAEYGLAGDRHAITVAASDFDDRHALFSNYGREIDVTAPGVDIVSLRARRTDTMLGIKDVAYTPGAAFVGADRRYYRVSGTSFAAPIVTGIASLLVGIAPTLGPDDVRRLLRQSARDIESPGVDQVTGYGIVDAIAAIDLLETTPGRFVDAEIAGVSVAASATGPVLRVTGTADADRFAGARLEIGAGEAPTRWETALADIAAPLRESVVGEIPAQRFAGARVWMLRLVATHADGREREARFRLEVN